MAINLGTSFEADVAELAGVTAFDPGTLDIALLNPNGGDTTVRFTCAINVDTAALRTIIAKYTS